MAKPKKPVVKSKRVNPWDSGIPKDAIGGAVRGVIRGELAPLEAQEQQGKAQLAGHVKWYGDTNTAFQNAMRGLQASSKTSASEMLRSAANRQVAHDREQNSALEFLRSTLLGDTGGPQKNLHLANDRLNTVKNVENRGLAGQIALNGQSNASVLSGMRGTGNMTTVDSRNRARGAYSDLMRQLALGKAQAIGKAPTLYRQMAMEQAAAEAALGESASKMRLEYDKMQNQRDIAGAELADGSARDQARQNAAAVKNRGQYWKYGIDRKFDSELNQIYKGTKGLKKHPWRATFGTLSDIGLSPDQSAMLATRWIGRKDPKSTAVGWLQMLNSRGVSITTQKSILRRLFGPGSYGRAVKQSRTAARDATRSAQEQIRTVTGMLGSIGSGSNTGDWV